MLIRIAALLLLPGLGCAGPGIYAARATLGGRVSETSPIAPAPRLLSAHLARAPVGEPSEILVVFSTEVDPATLEPRSFVVVLRDGALVLPDRALLDPADEFDENRSVTLHGAFGSPEANPPVAVRVVGNLYAEDGSSLAGLDATVRAYEMPDEVVWIEILRPDEHRCPGARQVIRSYWTDDLRGVAAQDLELVKVSFSDGSESAPVGFDDHADLGGEDPARDDNVLDLCLDRDVPVSAVSLPEGVFEDAAGHPTAASLQAPSRG